MCIYKDVYIYIYIWSYIYIYIYIYMYRERDLRTTIQQIHIYIYIKASIHIKNIYTHTRIKVTPVRAFGGSLPGQVPSETLRQQKHSDKPKLRLPYPVLGVEFRV